MSEEFQLNDFDKPEEEEAENDETDFGGWG